jgi:hypothetical protein
MLNKTHRLAVPFIMAMLILGLTLPACTATETPPAGGALSFEAAEYTNTEYGFSVKYPKDWQEIADAGSTTVFAAAASKRVPTISISILDSATFDEALAALTTAGSDVKIETKRSTTLADGTPASEAVLKWKVQNLSAQTFALGVQKDSKWIVVGVTTVPLLAKYDEALFSEIAHTLQFK